jgi:uncharacterized LabA/DUF88 family protein
MFLRGSFLYNIQMRRIVLIDGENFVYGIRILLGTPEEKAPRSIINQLNIRGVLEELLSDNPPSELIWFGAKMRIYEHTEELRNKSYAAVHIQSAFVNYLQKQRIQFIKVGNLRARETEACSECGHQTWKLAEKGVDVGLAVRMLTEAREDTELVVVTSDTDLVPAFKAAKKLGAKLMHVGYENRPITALSQLSSTTRVITVPLLQKFNK